jgi:PPOX class probable F420-dependent enzyme
VDLQPDEARLLLASARVARLATVRPDGAPHVVPICFAMDGDTLVTAIDAKPKRPGTPARLRNIASQPRVAVLADGWDEDWTRLWWVRLDGEAAIVESHRARSLLCDRYQQYRHAPPAGPVIVVRAVRWSGWRAASPA